jgi:cytochrome b
VTATTSSPIRMVPVWDLAVRVLHWSLVLTVAAAWLTRHSPGRWHEWIGYATLAIVTARAGWGFIGRDYARFSQFVRAPGETASYARSLLSGSEARYIGHNPLGGWMVVALLAMVALVGFTGWLYTTDRYWGIPWVEELHESLSDILLAFVGLHIIGVVFTSRKHRENLVAAMLHGRKRDSGVS